MRRLLVPIIVLVALQPLDIWTTHIALNQYGGVEANPITTLILALGGFAALSLVKLAVVGVNLSSAVLHVRKGLEARALTAICVLGVIYSGVVGWNLYGIAAA